MTEQSESNETQGSPLSTSSLDVQVGGDHYKNLKIEPIEYCYANNISFIEASVIKYVTRHKWKGKAKDLDKAIHCLQVLKELEYPDE